MSDAERLIREGETGAVDTTGMSDIEKLLREEEQMPTPSLEELYQESAGQELAKAQQDFLDSGEVLEELVKPTTPPIKPTTPKPVVRPPVDYQKVIDNLEFERNKFIYGQYQEGDMTKNQLRLRKGLRQITTLISYSRLAFDPAMQLGNLVSGNVQMFLAAQGEKYGMGTYKDWAWAKKEMYSPGGFIS